jgi:hypothetical protein
MSMQALNHLVARSIVDPSVVQAFGNGTLDDILADLAFSGDLRASLSGVKAESWAEFAVLAYRTVKAAEMPAISFQMPSPLEGLRPDSGLAGREQVA